MEDINKIELEGRVGNVSVINVGGTSVAHVSLATNEALSNGRGEVALGTVWHCVTIWRGEDVPDPASIRKGDRLHVEGRVRVNKFTGNDNVEKLFYEVIAHRAEIVKTKRRTPLAARV